MSTWRKRFDSVEEERKRIGIITFVSNCGGNLIVLRSFNSLSEKRRSWSADVPLKKPERKKMRKKDDEKGKGELASVCHGCKVAKVKVKVNVDAAPKAEKTERHSIVSFYSLFQFNTVLYPQYVLQLALQPLALLFLLSMSQPGDRQSASPSQPGDSVGHAQGFSRTSIALICSFLICLIFFVYLSSKPPRISEPVRASSSRPRRSTPKRPKPKLWDICLDDDPHHVLEPPDKAMCNWRVSPPYTPPKIR